MRCDKWQARKLRRWLDITSISSLSRGLLWVLLKNLEAKSVLRNFARIGEAYVVERNIVLIISVGYHIKSKRCVQFRFGATWKNQGRSSAVAYRVTTRRPLHFLVSWVLTVTSAAAVPRSGLRFLTSG
jgi:hypothetical protein